MKNSLDVTIRKAMRSARKSTRSRDPKSKYLDVSSSTKNNTMVKRASRMLKSKLRRNTLKKKLKQDLANYSIELPGELDTYDKIDEHYKSLLHEKKQNSIVKKSRNFGVSPEKKTVSFKTDKKKKNGVMDLTENDLEDFKKFGFKVDNVLAEKDPDRRKKILIEEMKV